MIGHGGGAFERTAILQIGGDAGGPKSVAPDFSVDPSRLRTATDHGIGIGLGQGSAGHLTGPPPDRAEQRPSRIIPEPGRFDIGLQIVFQRVVAGHFMLLAAFFVQAHPEPPVLDVDIANLHRERRADPGKAEGHQTDQGAVAQPGHAVGWQTPAEFASTFNPRRALALRNAKSSAPLPTASPAQLGNTNPGNGLGTG